MPIENAIKSNTKPYKRNIFRIYIYWYSLPTLLRKMPQEELDLLGFDTTDSLFSKLLKIKTDREFAKIFDIRVETLCKWKKRKDFQDRVNEVCQQNIIRFKKDVDFAFTNKTIKDSDASRVKLWKQLFEGWSEKQKVEHSGELGELLVKISNAKEPVVKRPE